MNQLVVIETEAKDPERISSSVSIGVDDSRWTYTVRPFAAVAIDVVVGPLVAADSVVCISISVDDGGGWTRNAVTIVNRTW